MNNNPKIRHPADARWSDSVKLIGEDAYRRGFVQGVESAIDALMNGKTAGGLDQWLNQVLRKWRGAPKDKAIKPPSP
jgi:hypothetical protein